MLEVMTSLTVSIVNKRQTVAVGRGRSLLPRMNCCGTLGQLGALAALRGSERALYRISQIIRMAWI
tara:strand:- start:353 stop:550 length:198 start_codon:yes stop_codon:yes gene_type:complete